MPSPQPWAAGSAFPASHSGKFSSPAARSAISISAPARRSGSTGINMTLSLRSLGSALISDGSAVWNGERVTFAVNIDKPRASPLRGREPDRDQARRRAAHAQFRGPGRGFAVVKARWRDRSRDHIAAPAGAMGGIADRLGGDGLGPFALKGTVAIAGTKTSFKDADISLDAIRAKGSVSVDNAGARPAVIGSLDIDRLDLNPYLSLQTASATPPARRRAALRPGRRRRAQNGRSGPSHRFVGAQARRYRFRPQGRRHRLPPIPDRRDGTPASASRTAGSPPI